MHIDRLAIRSLRAQSCATCVKRLLCQKLIFAILLAGLFNCVTRLTFAREPADNSSSRETESDAKRNLSAVQMPAKVHAIVNEVVDNPSFFRRMPTQTIDCDPQLFKHLVRYPEVLVNIWDLMGITQVTVKRTAEYTFVASDGVGTTCKCDLIYSNDRIDIYYGQGAYQGTMTPRAINGRCVCVLYSQTTKVGNREMIAGTMDVFLKLDNFGADLVTRTLAPFVGKTADYNFVESAKFLAQISHVCETNPEAAQALAAKLDKVDPTVRDEFARIAARIANDSRSPHSEPQRQYPVATSAPIVGTKTLQLSDLKSANATKSAPSNIPLISLSDSPTAGTDSSTAPVAQPLAPVVSANNAILNSQSSRRGWSNTAPNPVAPVKPNVYMRP